MVPVVHPAGLEPTTLPLKAEYSIHLSYGCVFYQYINNNLIHQYKHKSIECQPFLLNLLIILSNIPSALIPKSLSGEHHTK